MRGERWGGGTWGGKLGRMHSLDYLRAEGSHGGLQARGDMIQLALGYVGFSM